MKDLMSDLNKGMYTFKDPWRPSNKSLTLVVPIVATKPRERTYVVLEEVEDRVKIVDTGEIDEARIEGGENRPVFVRGGTMLKGATQERAMQFGIVVIPQKSEPVPVHCIHASRGIQAGAKLKAGGMSPRRVLSAIIGCRNQEDTWSEISRYSLQCIIPAFSSFRADDLVGTVEAMQKFREELKEILKQIPDYVNQVGAVVIDPSGVLGLEMYDHPDSWKALSESIMHSFADELAKEDQTGILNPDMSAAVPLIQSFLRGISKAKREEVFKQNNGKTAIIGTRDYVGEYTTLNGKTIHLLITRRNPPQELMNDVHSRSVAIYGTRR